MPYYQRLIDRLIAAPQHVQPDGTIDLSHAEAEMFRACGFLDAKPGWWPIPPIPAHVPVPDFLFRLLPQLKREPTSQPPQPRLTPPVAPLAAAPLPLATRLSTAYRHPLQRCILRSLARRASGRCRKRQLQQALHRMRARDLNQALDRLVTAGLIVRDGGYLTLDSEARRLLIQAGRTVSLSARARALARERARRSRARAGVRYAQQEHDSDAIAAPRRHRPYRPRPVPDRRRFPSRWGRHMAAKRAGQVRQRLCRAAGICATDAATTARLKQRALQQRRQAASSASVTVASPVTSFVTQRAPGDVRRPVATSTTVSTLSEAWRSLKPIGRDARLAAERNRR
jgi:hypothetical protein